MKKVNFMWLLVSFCMTGVFFSACSDDDDDNPVIDPVVVNHQSAYILNEGSYDGNNAGFSVYQTDTKTVSGDIFYSANSTKLGDTGQDLIINKDYLFVSVYGSSYIAKTDMTGALVKSYNFSESEGLPRYLETDGTYIYVSLYSGRVAKFDAETFTFVDTVSVGMNPEQMAILNNQLIVANSGWGAGKTLSVIDLSTFTLTKTIEVGVNPNYLQVCDGKLFVLCFNDYSTYLLQQVDVESGTVTTVGNATKFTQYEGKLYCVNSVTDWATYATTNSFFTYDVATGTTSGSFLPESTLTSETIYCIAVCPVNGDIYLSTTDYVTNGTVYRFSNEGEQLDVIDAGGINPSKVIFY